MSQNQHPSCWTSTAIAINHFSLQMRGNNNHVSEIILWMGGVMQQGRVRYDRGQLVLRDSIVNCPSSDLQESLANAKVARDSLARQKRILT